MLEAPDNQDAPAAVAPSSGPSPSPPSFWDRSTWDPDSLGAIAFGQPVAPYRPQGQVLADAYDAILGDPTHPDWDEPITRMTLDDIMSYMSSGPRPDGLLTPGLRLLAASGHPDPDLQAWAANDAAMRAGAHPLWDLKGIASVASTAASDPSVCSGDTDANDTGNETSEQDDQADNDAVAPVASLTTSPKAASTIKTFEAPGGRPFGRYHSLEGGTDTFGLGHKGLPGGNGVKFDPEAAYNADLRNAEAVVKGAVTIPLKQHQFDALVSFAMNEPGAFRRSTQNKPNAFLDELNSENFAGATSQMLTHNTYFNKDTQKRIASGGLQRRRFHEADMFSNGAYRPF